MPIDVDLTDLIEFAADFDRFPAEGQAAAEQAMGVTVEFLHGKLPAYPEPPAPGQAAKFWTDKQRRFFFAALREGRIKVPYKRTDVLGGSFTTSVSTDGDAVVGELGTNTDYAPWVVGPGYPGEAIGGRQMWQARIHAGRWWQLDDVFAANKDAAVQVFADEFYARFMAAVTAEA